MFIVVGVWISPAAIGALALGIGLGLRGAWWVVLIVVAACAALAVTAALWLMRWNARHAAGVWAQRPAQLRAEQVTELPPTERAAIGPAVVNLNFYGVPADERAAIIRAAIPGPAEGAARIREL